MCQNGMCASAAQPACGDGQIDAASEECDDENQTDGDGCDAQCRIEFHEDFEGDVSAWALQGGAIETNDGTSSTALHIITPAQTCGAGSAQRTVSVPASAAAIRFELSGNVPSGSNDFQMWMTLGGHLAQPVLPLTSTVRQEAWCVPEAMRGTSQMLSFVVRTQNTCVAIDAWIDAIAITADGTDCIALQSPI